MEEKRITLNEPVCDTIVPAAAIQKRDLFQIGFKIKQVMLPSLREEGKKQMRNCNNKVIQGICGDRL